MNKKRSLRLHIPVFVIIRTVLNTAIRMVYPFLPLIGRSMGVDLVTLSRAVTLRSASGVFGPLLGTVADTRGRRTGMLLGLSLFTVGVGLMVFWSSYTTFAFMLVLSILGVLTFLPSMQAYLGDRVPYRQRAFALALTEISWSLSFIIGVPIIAFLIARGGWTAPFPFLLGAGVLAMAALLWMLPRDRSEDGSPAMPWQNLRKVLTYKPALAGIIMALTFSASNELVNLIFGVWLEDSFGVKIAALAAASMVIGVSELSGEVLVIGITDRMGKRRAIGIGLLLNSFVALGLPFLGTSMAGALVGLFFFYLTFEFTIVSSLPLMNEILPVARATMMAVFMSGTSVGRAFGDMLAVPLYGYGESTGVLSGIIVVVIGVVMFNAIALLALRVLSSSVQNLGSRD
ncbi:MAG: MFS transporter [Anaerolineales bacterium]